MGTLIHYWTRGAQYLFPITDVSIKCTYEYTLKLCRSSKLVVFGLY